MAQRVKLAEPAQLHGERPAAGHDDRRVPPSAGAPAGHLPARTALAPPAAAALGRLPVGGCPRHVPGWIPRSLTSIGVRTSRSGVHLLRH